MTSIVGKWVMAKGQPFAGLWFQFNADGTYQAEMPGLMKITSSGRYTVEGDYINIRQTRHSLGLVGEFNGRFAVEGDVLKLAMPATPGGARPADLSAARIYNKAS